MDLENFPTSETAKEMLSYVSAEFYAKSYVAKWLYQVMGLEWDEVWAIVESLAEQAFPETATWGLMYHEIKYGLPISENMTYEERRRAIYLRRDVRRPMNPYGMEQLIYSITGCTAEVRDSNDDGSIPANTFTIAIHAGDDPVDLAMVFKKINQVKQSHVTYSIRVCADVGLTVNTSEQAWKRIATICGTTPKESRGLVLDPSDLEVGTSGIAYRSRSPMTGDQQITGTFPLESRGLAYANTGDSTPAIGASTATFGSKSRVCGSASGL